MKFCIGVSTTYSHVQNLVNRLRGLGVARGQISDCSFDFRSQVLITLPHTVRKCDIYYLKTLGKPVS